MLPWQKCSYEILDDDDDSLSPDYAEEFEAEANYFASATLFQHDRFMTELKKYGLAIESAIQLAKHFGASIHATLRRYVEQSPKRCALIVLENITPNGSTPKCNVKDIFLSEGFIRSFNQINIPFELGYSWKFVQDYYHKARYIRKGNVIIPTENESIDCDYHFFNNHYNAFVLLFPQGEHIKSRTKIILNQ